MTHSISLIDIRESMNKMKGKIQIPHLRSLDEQLKGRILEGEMVFFPQD